MVLPRFGLKTGIDFAHYGLESGMVFEKTTGGYEIIYRRFQFQMNKKEREICEFVVDFKNSFLLAFYSNFLEDRSENGSGSGFGEPGSTPPPRIPRSTPPPPPPSPGPDSHE